MKTKDQILLEEAYHQVKVGRSVFRSPEEVFKALTGGSKTSGSIKIQKENGEPTLGTFIWNPQSQHLSINWREEGQDFGVDFNPSDKPFSRYPFQEDETSFTVEWSPGERVVVLK